MPILLPALTQAMQAAGSAVRATTKAKPPSSPSRGNIYVSPPVSESNLDLAKKHFKAGINHYAKKGWRAALNEFQKSYALIRILDTQYNIGLCHEKLGEYAKAIAAFQLFIQGRPGRGEQEEGETRIAWVWVQMNPLQRTAWMRAQERQNAEEQTSPAKPVPLANTKTSGETKRSGVLRIPKDETWKMPYQENVAAASPTIAEAPPAAEKQKGPIPPAPLSLPANGIIPPNAGMNATVGLGQKSGSLPVSYRNLMWTSLGLSQAGLVAGLIGHLGAKSKQAKRAERVDALEREGKITEQWNQRNFIDQQTADTYRPKLDRISSEKNKFRGVAITGFVGSAVFLGFAGVFYWLDRKEARLSAMPLTGGVAAVLKGNF